MKGIKNKQYFDNIFLAFNNDLFEIVICDNMDANCINKVSNTQYPSIGYQINRASNNGFTRMIYRIKEKVKI